MTANKPRLWQRLIPRYGNWGGPGWSAGRWNNDPALTDWNVPAVDDMDQACKEHDFVYQAGGNLLVADITLVARLHQVSVSGWWPRIYRAGAILVFSLRVLWFTVMGKYSPAPDPNSVNAGTRKG